MTSKSNNGGYGLLAVVLVIIGLMMTSSGDGMEREERGQETVYFEDAPRSLVLKWGHYITDTYHWLRGEEANQNQTIKFPLLNLPIDIHGHIFRFLDRQSLSRFLQINKEFTELIQEQSFRQETATEVLCLGKVHKFSSMQHDCFDKLESFLTYATSNQQLVSIAVLGYQHPSVKIILPLCAPVRHLGLHNTGLTINFAAMVNRLKVSNLTSLSLRESAAGDNEVSGLVSSLKFAGLLNLDLSYSRMSPDGVHTLSLSTNFTNLTTLNLESSGIGDAGMVRIFGSKTLTNLTNLNLRRNSITATTVNAISGLFNLTRLTCLNLERKKLALTG